MLYITINEEIIDSFQVLDKHDNPVTGLVQGDFTIQLYNPDGNNVANIPAGILVIITELANGFYRVAFTPDTLGAWNLIIIHNIYFSEGLGEDYYCLYSVGISQELENIIKRVLGLSQENYRIFNTSYDARNNLLSGLIKIYSTASDVDTDTNPIAQYQINAVFNRKNRMTSYKVKKIT